MEAWFLLLPSQKAQSDPTRQVQDSPQWNAITVRYTRPSAMTERLSEGMCISVNGRSAPSSHRGLNWLRLFVLAFSALAQFNQMTITMTTAVMRLTVPQF